MYSIVDKATNQVVPQKGQSALTFNHLGRVDLPNGDIAFSCQAGQEWPGYKLLAVTIQETGAGDVISDSPPVYDGTNVIVTRTRSASPKPTVLDYETFQNRFTQPEMDAATEFCEEINLANGKPKRPQLKQGLARMYAKGTVDLTAQRTEQFLQALVAGGVITSQRKAELLTP